MKNSFLISVFVIACISWLPSYATIWSVDNNTVSPEKYSNLQSAIYAASAGDTIYVSGSITSYGYITITKKLTIIGTGPHPQKDLPLFAQVDGIALDTFQTNVSYAAHASGTTIIGLWITGSGGYTGASHASYTGANPIINISFIRCYFSGSSLIISIDGGNILLEDNIFVNGGCSLNYCTNVIIRNNIFAGSSYASALINLLASSGLTITNNIFIDSVGTANIPIFPYGINAALITNNVFYGFNASSATNCTFNNNMSYANGSTANGALVFGNNTGSNNLPNTDPKFTSFYSTSFNYGYNYHLQSGSPGKGAGTDKTDIGIYGGVGFIYGGEPAIPQVKQLNIKSSPVLKGSKMGISVKAAQQN